MKLRTIILPLALASACVAVQSSADVLETKSKGALNGRFLGGTADSVRFKVGNDSVAVPINDVITLTFTGRGTNAAAGGASQGATGAGAAAATGAAAGGAASSSPATAVTIPAGTTLRIVMDTGVDSSRDK